MPAKMALIEEADLGRDHRTGHAFEQQHLCPLNPHAAQIAIRRRAVLLPEHGRKARHAERGQRRELRERHRLVEMRFDKSPRGIEAEGLFHDVAMGSFAKRWMENLSSGIGVLPVSTSSAIVSPTPGPI